ncbi:cell wall-binding protein [Desulfosporosinus youngiae DSM 17734]|uniref:Cell wall-binding protein n=1 Tax=Desulfosporosinus youngiae DSM 17734 TaxID=768710 RepID=H5XW60_9FIRM|nr:cell wall-binding protein [Desulfosporosinus youngiae DSM 17734]
MKKILSMFLVLCMVVTMLPGTALAEGSGVSNEADLNTAITNVPEGGTIILGNGIALTATVTIASGNTKSFTLDLNGKTLVSSTGNSAIVHNGSGTLTITDTAGGGGGKITCAYDLGTIELKVGSVVVTGGTVANTATTGLAIFNEGVGSVVVNGGTVQSKYGSITNKSTGSVSVTGGTVESSAAFPGVAIENQSTGSVSVSGGTVKNTGTGLAIYNSSTGKITVSGNAVVTGAPTHSSYGSTIYLFGGDASDTVLEITGGTIENTSSGKAIYNNASGKIVIPSGPVIIKGGDVAMNKAPELGAGMQARASLNYSGSPLNEYAAVSIHLYKYLQFEPPADVAQIGGTGYSALQAAMNAVGVGETIELLGNISLTEPVTISSSKVSSFTLDLKGKTISSNSSVLTTIQHEGGGTLTIRDSSSGGKIANTSSDGRALTIKITNNGSVTLLSGTIETSMGAIENLGSGDVTISGGIVKSTGPGLTISSAVSGSSAGSGNVMISGGTVESTNNAGTAIARGYGSSGKIIISEAAAITAVYRGIWLYGSASSEPILEITGGTLTHTGTTGYVIDVLSSNTILVKGGTLESTHKSVIGNTFGANLATVKINIPAAGSATFKGGDKVLADGYALTLENAGVSASENFDGTDPVPVYSPDAIGTYKYLAFGPVSKVDALDLSGKLTAPLKNATPITTGIETAQYTGTVAWSGSPVTFLGGTAYTANVSLTAKPGYTFSGLAENSFTFTAASVTHAAGSGNTLSAAVTFPATAAKELASIAVTTLPAKTGYKYKESFDATGMVVKATYDDGTVNPAFIDYNFSPQGDLNMSDTTITLTANGTSIITSLTITVTKADGPAAPTELSGVAPSSAGGTDGKITGATTAMEYADDSSFAGVQDCLGTEIIGLSAGTYYVRVKATATHEAGAYASVTVSAGVTKIAVPTANTGLKWTGSAQTGVNGGTGYTLSGDYEATDVGDYTATATPKSGYAWSDTTTAAKDISWRIEKADGPGAPSVSFSFDDANANKLMGATASMEYSLDGGSSWTDCTETMDLTASLGRITAEKDIQVRVKEITTHHAGAIQTIDITQPSAPSIGKTDETSALNNGTITGVSNLMEYKKSGAASYTTISGSTAMGLAPGEYLVRLKAAGTALASLDATVNIASFTKTTPTVADLIYSLAAVDYDGTEKPVSVTADSGKTLGAITVIYNGITAAPPINAGTYAVTVNIAGSAEYNAVTDLPLGSYTINKVAYTGPTTVSAIVLVSGQTGATVILPTLPAGASYGTPTTGGAITMTAMSIAGTTLTYTAPPSTAGQTGTMTIPVTGATNYSDCTIIVTVTSTAKTPQVISYATAVITKTYGDALFTNPLSQTTVNGTITYASDDTSVAMVDPNTGAVIIMAVGDGNATITATAAETGTHAQAAASYTVTVASKALTLKADDKSMTKGDGLPAFTYTATGLVNSDAVTTAPTISTAANGNAVGTFDITISDGVVANAASYNITYTKGILTVAERLFTVTVTNGTGSGSYAEGATVTIAANDRSGYTFTGWSGTDVTFADATAKTTTFTMPAKAVTVTPNYRQNSSGGDGGGSGGGGSSSDDSSHVIVIPPAADRPDSPTQGEIKVPGTVDSNGNVTVNITDKTVTDAFDKALAEARKNGNEQNGVTVVLRVDTGGKTASAVSVNLTKSVQETIISRKIVSTLIVVERPDVKLAMDLSAVTEINRQAKADVQITATRTDASEHGEAAQNAIGSRPAYDLAALYQNGGQRVSDFGGGSVTVEIPYTLQADEKAENIRAVYVNERGEVTYLRGAYYDTVRRSLIFSTNHFSVYGVGYKDDIIPRPEPHVNPQETRLSGETRYDTAAAIAEAYFGSGTDLVILARGDISADALPAVPLAKLCNAPLLLTEPDQLPSGVLNTIERLRAKKVIIIGGPGAVGDSVEAVLKADGLTVERIYGETHYDTAYEIAKRVGGASGQAVIVNGDMYEKTFADVLSISAWAGYNGIPILYADSGKDSLPTGTAKALAELGITRTILIGGTAVLPAALEGKVPAPKRYGGETRYDTNAIVLKELQPEATEVYAATGKGFADALAGAAVAAQRNGWLVLIGANSGTGLTAEQESRLSEAKERVEAFHVFGGEAVVPESMVDRMRALLGAGVSEQYPALKTNL